MSRVRVSTVIDAPPRRVWAEVRDITSHTAWMEDAVAIRYTSPRHEGVGTTFDCDTKVGPFRLTDRMEVTEWSEGKTMGIRHVGLVQGTGRFTIRRSRRGGTRFSWDERLVFPWWMGGAPGSVVAAPVLRRIWRRNLVNLKRQIEGPRRRRRALRRAFRSQIDNGISSRAPGSGRASLGTAQPSTD